MDLSSQSKVSGFVIPVEGLKSPEERLQPFAWFQKMRKEFPVSFDAKRNSWDLFRYDDILAVLKDPAAFSSVRPQQGPVLLGSILGMDPPKHHQMRNIVSKAFTPRSIAELEPRITEIMGELIAQTEGKTEIDLLQSISIPLPVIVIAELLGVPAADRQLFKDWTDRIAESVEDDSEAAIQKFLADKEKVRRELDDYFMKVTLERRKQPEDDLITKLVQAEVDGEKLTDEEIMEFCILLLGAGNETTTNLITNAVRIFMEEPSLQEKLRQQPELMKGAIEEVLRYYSPILAMNRYATKDVEIGGKQVKKGDLVVTWIGSANRDEEKFPDADRFIVDRTPNAHLAFGQGIHFCLGAPLARLEALIALPLILAHFHDMRLPEGTKLEAIPSTFVYGVKELPVQFTPAAYH
ncbi:cytochrome P450 [Brevibacillus borstelensis]|uniref:cytochrome P450 n=1 Tax=Brevibacillus borstelensis TaxID=45462 RepID=UPI002040DA13|nr:cytochrome P450 [Brevibacillus borstelensis]MCM3472111.1 cytochrome P450 [Brevibacillus borstelensis]